MKFNRLLLFAPCLLFACSDTNERQGAKIKLPEQKDVIVNDAFWSPKYETWNTVTVPDVFDKFEGKGHHIHGNAFVNFDRIANGEEGGGRHNGLPWFDGLIYESIRGVSDLLAQKENPALEERLDGYIARIAAAQNADPNGFLNTYTQLNESEHRWGENGGFLRFQHDVYNPGMLVEAGVHHYLATGKPQLLEVATRYANLMCDVMGPAPRKNIVPAHSGPEEALVKLFWLYKEHPEARKAVSVPVRTDAYFELATFWMEGRGHHCGMPDWKGMGNEAAERWIKENHYTDPKYGNHSRPTWGDYAQDQVPIFEQQTIEGHAVRATLLATGVAAAASQTANERYLEMTNRLWDNMTGCRMFVTGGVGAVHFDEKFGDDYFLPTDAYLETCAAVGSGFFNQRMNELTADAKYMDELERVLYNNVLTGVSLSGDRYTYQNPLNAHRHERWEWHPCPCCPPMFLKIIGAVPTYIYGYDDRSVYVNLFIGSEGTFHIGNMPVQVSQTTRYPWEGKVTMTVTPPSATTFALKVRIPGWAQGKENPFDLYTSDLKASYSLRVNGETITAKVMDGYVSINREWQAGDQVELLLPMQPRVITADNRVEALRGSVTLASGPLVYCIETADNQQVENLQLTPEKGMTLSFEPSLLGGVNVITTRGVVENQETTVKAIPYYAVGNRENKGAYRVWMKNMSHTE